MLFLPSVQVLPPPIVLSVRVRQRSYRFVVTNVSWSEAKDSVVIEALEGKRRLDRKAWLEFGFPNVYHAKADRQGESDDILISATCDGNLTQYTSVWLFSAKTKRLKLLSKALSNADDSRLNCGIVTEEGVDRWLFHPPRNTSPDDWYHRTWTYSRKTQRLVPGSWRPGMLKR